MKVPVSFRTSHAMTDKKILVDSGATNNFIHPRLVKRLGLGTNPLEKPKKVWNVDGTTNKGGELTHYVDLEVKTGSEKQKMRFLITDLGDDDLILGYPWLSTFEPTFSWHDGVIDTRFLPIIVRSLDWKERRQPIVARIVGGQRQRANCAPAQRLANRIKRAIVEELEREYTQARGISTTLAKDAQQYTKKVDIPDEYRRHARV